MDLGRVDRHLLDGENALQRIDRCQHNVQPLQRQ
jgi:hypothetical protein